MVNKKICSYLNKRLASIGVIPLLLGVIIITPSAYTQDTTPPQIMDVRDFPDPVEVGANINIDCTVIDNIMVASVSVFIYSPVDPPTNYSMTKIPDTEHGYYFSQQFNEPGAYAYVIYAIDPTGNINHSSEYFFTVEDLVPPEVNLIYPNGGEIVNGTVTIQWTATDDFDHDLNGSITIRYSFDGGEVYQTLASLLNNTGFYNWDTTANLDADTYKIRVSATDDNENTGQDSSESVFTVDNTPPNTALTVTGTLGENEWYIDNVTVTLTATDDTSGIKSTRYRINNGSWINYSESFPLTLDGNHTLEFYSINNGGLIEPVNIENVKVDATPPIVTFHRPQNRYLYIFDREIIRFVLKTVVIGKITIEPSINETGSGVERVVFQVDGETLLLDIEEPFEYEYDELALLRHRYTLGIGATDFAGHEGNITEQPIWILNI